MKKVPIWYLVANRTDAVLYRDNSSADFEFIARLSNEAGRQYESELVSDRPGRNVSSGNDSIRHGYTESNQHDEVAIKFAREIGAYIETVCREKEIEKLVLVAAPRFLGRLRKEMSPYVQGLISDEVHHEYNRGSDLEIRALIYKALKTA